MRAEPLGGGFLVAGAPHDVAPCRRERVDLRERAVDVGGLGGGHRLHRHRRGATHRHVTDVDLLRDPTLHHSRSLRLPDASLSAGRLPARGRSLAPRDARLGCEAIGTGSYCPPMTWRTSRNIADSAIVIRIAKNATPIGNTLR